MTTFLRRTIAALIASSVCLSTWAAVTASLDKTQVAPGERVRLVIQNTGKGDAPPDTRALQQDFDIVATQRGSSVQIINGEMSSTKQFTLLLAPKRSGTLRIAPIVWGGEPSNALELTVGAAANPAQAGANTAAPAESHITMSGTLDQKQPYVQSAVVLSLRLNVGVPMAQASLDLQGNSDVLVRQIGKDQQHTESRNGRDYQVLERKYLLIPQRSGAISLKGPLLQAQVQDDAPSGGDSDMDALFGNVFGQTMGRFARPLRNVSLQAESIEMNVLARPASANASNWLPAQKLTLEETWRPEQATLHVGEPLTRHLRLSALGVSAGQLPDLAALMPVSDGIKKYPDQAQTDEALEGESLRATRDQDVALIASAPGHYVLPAFQLVWWDTVNHIQKTIALPERSVDILPALNTSGKAVGTPSNSNAGVSPPTSSVGNTAINPNAMDSMGSGFNKSIFQAPTPWLWLSAALGVLWLGTLLLWWRARRTVKPATPSAAPQATPVKSSSASASLAALQRACQANDPHLARQHLLEWARAVWPQSPPRGLTSLSERLKEARYLLPIQQLDRACYTAEAPWNGALLAQAFLQPPKLAAVEKYKPEIPGLYE